MTGHLHLTVAPAAEDSLYELESTPADHQRLGNDRILAAVEMTNGACLLGVCKLPGTAVEKMTRLKEWRSGHFKKPQVVVAYLLCKKPYIAVGRLAPMNDIEAQTFRETQFEGFVRSEILTRGYARPNSLVDSPDVFACTLLSSCEVLSDGVLMPRERHVLVVALEVDKSRISGFILLVAVLGFALGIIVSIVKKDLGLGAEVGGAVFGLVAVLQGTMILMYK